MARASWLIPAMGSPDGCSALGLMEGTGPSRLTEAGMSGEAAARQRRPVPVAVVPEPEPPPVVVEPVTVRPAPKPAAPAPADLPARLAQALEVPVEPPGAYAGAGAHRRSLGARTRPVALEVGL